MSHTEESARDAVLLQLNAAWDADSATQGVEIEWEDREPLTEKSKVSTKTGKPLPWAQQFFRTIASPNEQIGGVGSGSVLNQSALRLLVFTAPGDGGVRANRIAQVVKDAFRGWTSGDLWTRSVVSSHFGRDGAHSRTDITVSLSWGERVG